MPVPIRPIRDNEDKRDYNGLIMDYSFLTNIPQENSKRIVEASNTDADTIVEIWTKADRVSENTYSIKNSNISNSDIVRLKSKGFISANGDEISFTSRGKTIITTMALGENNAFLNGQNKKSYKEILASMDKKGKNGYRIPKFAADNSNGLNLK